MISAAFIAFCSIVSIGSFLIGEDLTYGQILLVGEDEEQCITQFIFIQHPLKFLSGLDNTIAIVAVNHKDDTLSVLEVVAPQGSDLILTTDIPHGELDVLVFDSLDVEPWS